MTNEELQNPPDYKALYFDLLFQVARVHPHESRHETAKRYIRQAETHSGPAVTNTNIDRECEPRDFSDLNEDHD